MKKANTMDNDMKDKNGAAISSIEVHTPAPEISAKSCTGIDSSCRLSIYNQKYPARFSGMN